MILASAAMHGKTPVILWCLSNSQVTGFFFDQSIPQKTAVALGVDPKTTTANYPLSINTRCENRIFAAPRTSSHGSGARGAALLLPLSMPILTVSNSGQVLRGYMSRMGKSAGNHHPPPDAYRRPTALPLCARSGAAPALCCARLLAQGAGANWKGQRANVTRHGMGQGVVTAPPVEPQANKAGRVV